MYEPERTINGTFGEIWVDGYLLAESKAMEANISLDKTEVVQTGTLAKGYKLTGVTCKGKITINKVTSYWINLISKNLKLGRTTTCTIISKLADPDSNGQIERVKLTGCTFDSLNLVGWKAGELTEEEVDFTFTGWDILDSIPNM